jgi:hypothetical protein
VSGWDNTAAVEGGASTPPPGWARWTDIILARVRGRSIDDKLLDGAALNGDPVITVRRAKLLAPRYRRNVASALRRLVEAARRPHPGWFLARLPLQAAEVLENEPLILTLADELEAQERISPRGVILADRLVRDGDSPVYGFVPVSRGRDRTVEDAVRHARAALHLG